MKELFEIIKEIEKDGMEIIHQANEESENLIKKTKQYIDELKEKEIEKAGKEAEELQEKLVKMVKNNEKNLYKNLEKEKQSLVFSEDMLAEIVNNLTNEILE